MKDRATRHRTTQHLLQTHRLRRHLEIVVLAGATRAMLVFDGKRRAVGQKFHHICPPHQTQAP